MKKRWISAEGRHACHARANIYSFLLSLSLLIITSSLGISHIHCLQFEMQKYIEYMLSHLFSSAKGRDDKLFTAGPAFAGHPKPTIELACPEVGPSGSQLPVDNSADGAGLFPGLSWPAGSDEIKQFLLISEDPDAPLPDPIIHGIYYGIAPSVTGVNWEDLELADQSDEPYFLKGGFKYGKNRGGNVYIPPQPMRGHGPHRYFFELIALSRLIDVAALSAVPTSVEIQGAIDGDVVGWGEWWVCMSATGSEDGMVVCWTSVMDDVGWTRLGGVDYF